MLPHVAFLYEEHMRNPYIQSFNLTFEREIAHNTIGRVAYAGSKGTRLYSGREFNPAIYNRALQPPQPTSVVRWLDSDTAA